MTSMMDLDAPLPAKQEGSQKITYDVEKFIPAYNAANGTEGEWWVSGWNIKTLDEAQKQKERIETTMKLKARVVEVITTRRAI